MNSQILEQQLLNVASAMEEKIDAEMAELDKLEDDDIERIREKRLQEMKKLQDVRQEWLRNGHGKLNEISSDKDFFEEAKNSKKLVVHFYRNTTIFRFQNLITFKSLYILNKVLIFAFMRCKILDEHLKTLSKQHMETKFLKLDVDKCDWIVQRLNIRIIPTLAFVLDGKTKDYMRGFDDVGGTDDFSTEMLEWRLGLAKVINYKGDLNTPPDQRKKNASRGTRIIRGKQNEDSDSD